MKRRVYMQGILGIKNQRPVLNVLGLPEKLNELADTFYLRNNREVELAIEVTREKKIIRTDPQLGYLFGHLAPKLQSRLFDMGWIEITTKELAVDFMKKPAGFVKTMINNTTGETESTPMSLAVAEREEVSFFVQYIYMWLIDQGVPGVMSPDEYKERKSL